MKLLLAFVVAVIGALMTGADADKGKGGYYGGYHGGMKYYSYSYSGKGKGKGYSYYSSSSKGKGKGYYYSGYMHMMKRKMMMRYGKGKGKGYPYPRPPLVPAPVPAPQPKPAPAPKPDPAPEPTPVETTPMPTAMETTPMPTAKDTTPVPTAVDMGSGGFTIQILHSSDNESGFQDPNTLEEKIIYYSALTNGLEALADSEGIYTIHVAAGDHTLPGPFYAASAEVETFGTGAPGGSPGIADILFYNTIGFQANGMGNHEFDGGINEFAIFLAVADYPFLAANLDFTGVVLEEDTPDIIISDDALPCEDIGGTVSKSCYLTLGDGEVLVGLIGRAPAAFFNVIEEPDENIPGLDFVGGRDDTNAPLESAVPQVLEQVALLQAAGVSVIVLLDHAQDFTGDPLATQELFGIDVIITAGSTGFFAQSESDGPFNLLREGDVPDEDYPVIEADMDGNDVLIVESDQLWEYIGNLIVNFDEDGNVVDFDMRSGPIATTPEAVALLGDVIGEPDLAEDPDVRTILDDLQATPSISASFEEVGTTVFPLNGERADVRTRSTNLGVLAADSSVWAGNALAEAEGLPPVDIALKNGGGIRASIQGPSIIPLTIQSALAFDNTLTIVELTTTQLLAVAENAVSRVPDNDGRFAHVAGWQYTFTADNPALAGMESVDTPSRILEMALLTESGEVPLVMEGALVADMMNATFVMATNSFLVTGGDEYFALAAGNVIGETDLGEQQILQDYINEVLGGEVDIPDPPMDPLVIEI